MLRDVDELIVVDDMHQRKKLMFDKSDAFVALPGGIGTLEELVEQLTWAQLGRHAKPIVLVNIDGFWAPFLTLLEPHAARRPSSAPTWTCASSPSTGSPTRCPPSTPPPSPPRKPPARPSPRNCKQLRPRPEPEQPSAATLPATRRRDPAAFRDT